jgi:hypothetical protein
VLPRRYPEPGTLIFLLTDVVCLGAAPTIVKMNARTVDKSQAHRLVRQGRRPYGREHHQQDDRTVQPQVNLSGKQSAVAFRSTSSRTVPPSSASMSVMCRSSPTACGEAAMIVGQSELRGCFLRSRGAERARTLSSPKMRSSGWSVDSVHASSHGMQNIAATVWLRNVTTDRLCFPAGQGMST